MLTIFRTRMARYQPLSRWILWSCVALLFLAHLTSAERISTTNSEDRGQEVISGSSRYLTQDGSNCKSKILEDDGVRASSSSMEIINQEAGWLPGLKRLSDRVFRLVKGQEYHWPVLKLNQPRTILGIIFGGIGAGLSSAGGLGGGGLFVPLFNLLLQFDPKTSAALSNFMILGGSAVNLWINLQQHHPVQVHKPVIDFDVLLLMQPNMLLGISIGVILNVVFPAWLITASLAVVLGYMTVHSFFGGFDRWAKETKQNNARRRALEAPTTSDEEAAPELTYQDSSNGDSHKGTHDHANSLTKPLLNNDGPEEQLVLFPRSKIAALIIVWLAFFSVQVLRGGKGGQSILGIQQCGLGYWLLTSTQLPLALIITAWTNSQLRTPRRDQRTYDIQEVGYILGPEAGTLFPIMALVAGVLGGMLGIGGGMIINPMLFNVGMLPQVTAATCASMVFFSSSMSVIQYWLMGRIPINYAVISSVLCAVFSWFGIKIVHRAVTKYNRSSLIVFSVAAVMGVSAVLMVGFGGWGLWEQYEGGAYMGFHYPC